MSEKQMAIVGASIWPGVGPDLLANHTVVTSGRRIVSVGPADETAVPAGARTIQGAGLTVIPGLIDVHVHLGTNSIEGRPRNNAEYLATTPPNEMTMHSIRNAMRALCAGFTTLRVMGFRDGGEIEYRDFVEQGLLFGPRLSVAAWWISMTNGHGDVFFPRNRVRQEWDTADGPDEVRKLVRLQARLGGDFIKVMASGGTMSHGDKPTWPNYTGEELAALVDEAHSMEMPVAAHAHSAEGIRRSLAAGVDSIEHGTYATDESLAQMRETGTFLVPTLAISDWTVRDGAARGADPEHMTKMTQVTAQRGDGFLRAFEAGVRIAMGTDSSGDLCPFGEHAREFELYCELGLAPYQALETATVNGAALLGRTGELGVIAPGAVADLVVLDRSPLDDIYALRRPGSVCHLVKDGLDLSILLGNDDETRVLRVPSMLTSH